MTNPTQARERDELLPCPFCGGKSLRKDSDDYGVSWYVRCNSCSASAVASSPNDAEYWWNARTPSTQPAPADFDEEAERRQFEAAFVRLSDIPHETDRSKLHPDSYVDSDVDLGWQLWKEAVHTSHAEIATLRAENERLKAKLIDCAAALESRVAEYATDFHLRCAICHELDDDELGQQHKPTCFISECRALTPIETEKR